MGNTIMETLVTSLNTKPREKHSSPPNTNETKMNPFRIACISSGTGKNPWLDTISRDLSQNNIPVRIIQAESETLDTEEKTFIQLLSELKTCSFISIGLHGSSTYFKKFDRLITAVKKYQLPAFIESSIPEETHEYRHLLPYPDEDHRYLLTCTQLGGHANTRSLILWACSRIAGLPVTIPPLTYPAMQGCYHPDRPDTTQFEDHLRHLPTDRPVIGIGIYQGTYHSRNLHAVDALIREIEQRNIATLTIFFTAAPDPALGALGIRNIIETHLIQNGRPVIDVLLLNMGFSQLTLSDPGNGTRTTQPRNIFADLDIPVLQIPSLYKTETEWQASQTGLSPMEISSNIVWPEYDGQLIGIPLSCRQPAETTGSTDRPIPDRITKIAAVAEKLANLRRTPPSQKKLAILLYQYTSESDSLGGAFGLDVPQSIIELLTRLQNAGYTIDHIPDSGNDLIAELQAGLTNDQTWLDPAQKETRSRAQISCDTYTAWLSRIPAPAADKICRDWGKPPGDILTGTHQNLLIPGILNGNIFIGIQPPRGYFEQIETMYHSPDLGMPHQYLAYYRWIETTFGAHAVIHMGTHGTLEWLPGKSVGLSETCCPDIVLGDLPHFYPYIIDNPGEGCQAKRRSRAAVVDHLTPALMRSDGYSEVTELDTLLQEYFRAKSAKETGKSTALLKTILEIVNRENFSKDLGFSGNIELPDLRDNAERLYDYLCRVQDNLIKDGLHIFGRPPQQTRRNEMIYSLTRQDNGSIPSLRKTIAEQDGCSIRDLSQNPADINTATGRPNGAVLESIDQKTRDLIDALATAEYDPASIETIIRTRYPNGNPAAEQTLRWICTDLVPKLEKTTLETEHLLHGLNGGYVPPGPSGDPARGNAHLLPTGKNFYSIDPAQIPTPAAWETGKVLADQMIQRYIDENGCYPENVGIVVFATDTMKSGGDDIAYLLWLMGLSPVWSNRNGRVTGLEIIPSRTLGRPRIDVTLRISGLFRDAFPTLMNMIDEGIEMIATLDEADDINYLSAHLKRDLITTIARGLSEEEAKQQSLIRIFGCPPGNYGSGISEVITASQWQEKADLADVYATWSAYAYSRSLHGKPCRDLFTERFGQLDVTVKNQESREQDILDHDDDYAYLGGMNACVKTYGGTAPFSCIGDASDPETIQTSRIDEEIRFVFRSRLLNPKWIEGLKPHGYRGVQEITAAVEYTFGWDATSDAVDDWEYQELAEQFLFDPAVRQWIEENNPAALNNIAGRLLEASDRGLWSADPETVSRLQEIYLAAEGMMEGKNDTE